jgi:hypothetical protein
MKGMLLFIALIVYGKIDHSNIIVDHVDVIEINHLYSDKGALVLDQCIYYKWKRTTVYKDRLFPKRGVEEGYNFEVVDWRMIKPGRVQQTPEERKEAEAKFKAEWRKRVEAEYRARRARMGRKTAKNREIPVIEPPPYVPPFDPGNMVVVKNHKTGKYEQTFLDDGVLRRIISGSVRETWTQHDPEVEARALVPKDSRIKLGKPIKK